MEEWVVALIVLGILTICILISVVLAHIVNKSKWKSRMQKKKNAVHTITTERQPQENGTLEQNNHNNFHLSSQTVIIPNNCELNAENTKTKL